MFKVLKVEFIISNSIVLNSFWVQPSDLNYVFSFASSSLQKKKKLLTFSLEKYGVTLYSGIQLFVFFCIVDTYFSPPKFTVHVNSQLSAMKWKCMAWDLSSITMPPFLRQYIEGMIHFMWYPFLEIICLCQLLPITRQYVQRCLWFYLHYPSMVRKYGNLN